MAEQCKICGTKLADDLFAAVTQEPVCSICKVGHIGGLPTTAAQIEETRARLGLKPGEYFEQDNADLARRILGR